MSFQAQEKTLDKLLEAYYKDEKPKSLRDWAKLASISVSTVYRNQQLFRLQRIEVTKSNKYKHFYELKLEKFV